MYKLIIVDDETIVRTSLATLLDWNEAGFEIVGSVANGKTALNLINTTSVDLVLTDIKMPVMDGIELITNLNDMNSKPIIIVLSAYNEFELVRQAFKLGAEDYILKSDISTELLKKTITSLKKKLEINHTADEVSSNKEQSPSESLKQMVLGKQEIMPDFFGDKYYISCIEIDDFNHESLRFGADIEVAMVQPLLEFAQQIPRILSKCVLTFVSPSRYFLYYSDGEYTSSLSMVSICTQLQKVWKNYMNISVSVGISSIGTSSRDFVKLVQESTNAVTLKFIFGRNGIFEPDIQSLFSVKEAQNARMQCSLMVDSLKNHDSVLLLEEQQKFIAYLYQVGLEKGKIQTLYIVYNIAIMLADRHDDLWNVFDTDTQIDFYQKIARLQSIRDLEMWITNFTRWIAEYLDNNQLFASTDVIEKAKRFIADNYSNHDLSLESVAEHVNLNKKYFCTKFNKEVGRTFTAYVTKVRIAMAQKMILKTDMKMYEISDAVGFNSVEHFTRVFKKQTGTNPTKAKP